MRHRHASLRRRNTLVRFAILLPQSAIMGTVRGLTLFLGHLLGGVGDGASSLGNVWMLSCYFCKKESNGRLVTRCILSEHKFCPRCLDAHCCSRLANASPDAKVNSKRAGSLGAHCSRYAPYRRVGPPREEASLGELIGLCPSDALHEPFIF